MRRKRSWQPTVTSFDVLKRVWKQGNHVDQKDEEDGSTALHQAAEAGSRVITWLLLKKGADVNARDGMGRTAMHLACEAYHKTSKAVVNLLLEYKADVNLQNDIGETPLHVACWARDVTLVCTLLKKGSILGLADRNGFTPLHVVALFTTDEVFLVDVLIKCLADANAVDSTGRSPLHWACSVQGVSTVYTLLDSGGDVNMKDSSGDTPLHIASVNKRKELVPMLVNAGADVNAINVKRRTALHLAAMQGSADIIDVLVNNGADVNAEDYSGKTPLHLAISWIGNNVYLQDKVLAEVLEKLLNCGAKIDVRNSLHQTPFEDMVELEETFCSKDFESSSDKVKKLTDLFIEHAIKLKTANLPVEVDITKKLKSVKFVLLQLECKNELLRIKSVNCVEDVSLYLLFSQFEDPSLLSDQHLQTFHEYLKSPDLLEKFPLYGYLLRNALFEISNRHTRSMLRSEEETTEQEALAREINELKEYVVVESEELHEGVQE